MSEQTDEVRAIRRGQIYWVAPDEPRGSVPPIAHPYVVVQDDLFNASRIATVVVCGITTNVRRAGEPGTVLLAAGEGGLPRQSIVVASQISSVSKSALGACVGTLAPDRVEEVLSALRFLQGAFLQRR